MSCNCNNCDDALYVAFCGKCLPESGMIRRVNSLPDVFLADRDHMYLTSDGSLYVLNYERDGYDRVSGVSTTNENNSTEYDVTFSDVLSTTGYNNLGTKVETIDGKKTFVIPYDKFTTSSSEQSQNLTRQDGVEIKTTKTIKEVYNDIYDLCKEFMKETKASENHITDKIYSGSDLGTYLKSLLVEFDDGEGILKEEYQGKSIYDSSYYLLNLMRRIDFNYVDAYRLLEVLPYLLSQKRTFSTAFNKTSSSSSTTREAFTQGGTDAGLNSGYFITNILEWLAQTYTKGANNITELYVVHNYDNQLLDYSTTKYSANYLADGEIVLKILGTKDRIFAYILLDLPMYGKAYTLKKFLANGKEITSSDYSSLEIIMEKDDYEMTWLSVSGNINSVANGYYNLTLVLEPSDLTEDPLYALS